MHGLRTAHVVLKAKYRKQADAASGEGTEFAAAIADSSTIQGCTHARKEEGRRKGAPVLDRCKIC
jgi:hypothetical protein